MTRLSVNLDPQDTAVAGASAAAPRRRIRLGRIFAIVGLSVLAVLVLLQLLWTFSGSSQWELLGEHDGVTVYYMKSPGYNNLKFKGVTRLHVKMNAIAAALKDSDMSKAAGFTNLKMIDDKDPQHFLTSSSAELPLFFKPRQYIEDVDLAQHHQSKEIILTITAAPEKLPPDSCCVRVTRMNNQWRFTPLDDKGNVELQLIINADLGGLVPYFLYNAGTPEFLYTVLPMVQGIMSEAKYQNAKFDFIEEVNPDGK